MYTKMMPDYQTKPVTNSRNCWVNMRYFILGLIAGVGLLYIVMTNGPTIFGLRHQKDVEFMEQKLDTQYERYKTCDGKLNQASSDVASITKSNEENKKKLESCEKDVEEKEDENEELQGNIVEIKVSLDTKTEEVNNLKGKLEEVEEENDTLNEMREQEINDLHLEIESLKEQITQNVKDKAEKKDTETDIQVKKYTETDTQVKKDTETDTQVKKEDEENKTKTTDTKIDAKEEDNEKKKGQDKEDKDKTDEEDEPETEEDETKKTNTQTTTPKK